MSNLKERVEEIRRRLAAGERNCDIAADFGVSRSTISLIGLGKLHPGPDDEPWAPAPAVGVIRHTRWCCDCQSRFTQYEYGSFPMRALVRCSRCAAAIWRRFCAEAVGRVLH